MNHATTYKTEARIFGVFFIVAFLAYGTGSALIKSIAGAPDILSSVYAHQTLFVVGAILMAVVHTFTNIGLPVVLYPVLKPYNQIFYFGYLSAAIVANVILVFGVIFLLLLLPLSDEYVRSGSVITGPLETMALVLRKGGFFSYQLGMVIWGLGGLLFCTILYQSKIVPRLMSIWGMVGYIVFISGAILEIFGYEVGLFLDGPGGLFEIALSLWLIVRGFRSAGVK